MSKKTITITQEQFSEAVVKATTEWSKLANESGVVTSENIAVMMLQNTMFSSMIAKNLFAENETEATKVDVN